MCMVNENEFALWSSIEGLGGAIWSMSHYDADHGPCPGVSKALEEMQADIEKLVREACDSFNVIHPRDYPECGDDGKLPSPPDGYRYYWDWYQEMKDEYHKRRDEFHRRMVDETKGCDGGIRDGVHSDGY